MNNFIVWSALFQVSNITGTDNKCGTCPCHNIVLQAATNSEVPLKVDKSAVEFSFMPIEVLILI